MADNTFILPERLPLFPLPDHVLLPGIAVPFRIFEPRYRALFSDLLDRDPAARWLAIPRLAPGWEADYQGRPPIVATTVAAWLRRADHHPDGNLHVVVEGHARIRLDEIPSDHLYRLARPHLVRPATDAGSDFSDLVDGLATLPEMSALWGRLAASIPVADDVAGWTHLLDVVGALLLEDPDHRQALLDAPTLAGRAEVVRAEILRRRAHKGLWKPSEN
jgi:Lon protease-like protein